VVLQSLVHDDPEPIDLVHDVIVRRLNLSQSKDRPASAKAPEMDLKSGPLGVLLQHLPELPGGTVGQHDGGVAHEEYSSLAAGGAVLASVRP
jgi:hypothetical protein